VKPLREVLGESYIGAVAIAVLLFWSIELVLWALWGPCYRAVEFIFTAIAILGIPYSSHGFTMPDWLLVFRTISYLFSALAFFAAAWVLSRWVYERPLGALMQCRARLARRSHA
jgi:hypothetical protein